MTQPSHSLSSSTFQYHWPMNTAEGWGVCDAPENSSGTFSVDVASRLMTSPHSSEEGSSYQWSPGAAAHFPDREFPSTWSAIPPCVRECHREHDDSLE